MRIAVMGAGAVGSYFGAKLARAGNEVVFVGRGEHSSRMRRNGLSVRSLGGDFHIYVTATSAPELVGKCDLVLFTVKTYDTLEAAAQMHSMVGDSTIILPLQNGVENERILGEIFGPEKVLGGLCYVGARIEHPGEVIHSAAGRVVVGELSGEHTVRAAQVANLFDEAGVEVKLSTEIMADKFKKLFWNISFNSVSALTRALVGRMLDVKACRETLEKTIDEAAAVARAAGVEIEEGIAGKVLGANEQFRDLKTSMLQDVERGSRLEFEALNGAVSRLGRVHGVPTPVNDVLYSLVRCADFSVKD